jgi:hypothetical protein
LVVVVVAFGPPVEKLLQAARWNQSFTPCPDGLQLPTSDHVLNRRLADVSQALTGLRVGEGAEVINGCRRWFRRRRRLSQRGDDLRDDLLCEFSIDAHDASSLIGSGCSCPCSRQVSHSSTIPPSAFGSMRVVQLTVALPHWWHDFSDRSTSVSSRPSICSAQIHMSTPGSKAMRV